MFYETLPYGWTQTGQNQATSSPDSVLTVHLYIMYTSHQVKLNSTLLHHVHQSPGQTK